MYLNKIINDKENLIYKNNNVLPLYQVNKGARILIIGQAPGLKTQKNNKLFLDQSGKRLKGWLDINDNILYSKYIAILPMDFYFPGKGKTGDLPPRKGFANKWHPLLIKEMPNIKLIILLGKYAIKHYLNEDSVTDAVKNYNKYLPKYFPLIHPSPLNQRWISKNPWFINTLDDFKIIVKEILQI